MDDKNKESKDLKELLIEQETSLYENLTEGQLAEYLASNESDY